MQNKRNIIVVAPYKTFPARMGGQRAIALLYNLLGKAFNITIASVTDNEEPTGYSFTLEKILGNSKFRYINPLLYFRMQALLKKNNSKDLILVHPYLGWLAVLLKWFNGVNFIIQSQNIESERFKTMGKWWWPILWHYERFVHRQANHNFFITNEDSSYALTKFGLKPYKTHTVTYGIEIKERPNTADITEARNQLRRLHAIQTHEKIILFNGSLDYSPNIKAIDYIIDEIVPRLENANFPFKLIVCGKGLPEKYNALKAYKPIIYTGFVEDITTYFKGADIFINPVNEGGGIKTKLVEAIGYNLSAVSTRNGAYGVPEPICGEKLKVVDNENWQGFVEAIMHSNTQALTPDKFYQHFYWENIAAKTTNIINS